MNNYTHQQQLFNISVICAVLSEDNNENHPSYLTSFSSLKQYAVICNLDTKQTICFSSICSSFILSQLSNILVSGDENYSNQLKGKGGKDQLLMFLTGPAGSGKSYVIKCSRIYCKLFCKEIGMPFNSSLFPVIFVSDSAASMFEMRFSSIEFKLNTHDTLKLFSPNVCWHKTKMLIVEGTSMIPKQSLVGLDSTLRKETGKKDLLYGGIHIVFVGDFTQLPPVSGASIYNEFNDIFWHGSLNACLFLDNNQYRFKDDLNWCQLLSRMQKGSVTDDDINILNSRLVQNVSVPEIVDCFNTRVSYACVSNQQRIDVLHECFLHHVKNLNPSIHSDLEPNQHLILIKGLVKHQGVLLGSEFHQLFWAVCNENNVISAKKVKVDPCLKLFYGCPLIINSHTTTGKVYYNGTVNFVGINWKVGIVPRTENFYGHKIYVGVVSDIESLVVQLESKRTIEIPSEVFQIVVRFDQSNKKLRGFEINQFPVNLVLADTIFSMEGTTKDIVVVCEVCEKMSSWLYVVLCHLATLNGLFLLQPLKKEMFKPMSLNVEEEIRWLHMLEIEFLNQISAIDK
jgi:hypothetical protein